MPAPGLCAFSNKRKFFLLSSLLSQAGPAARMGAGLVLSQRGDWGPLSGRGTRSLTLGCPLGNLPCYLSRRGKEGGRNRSRAALLLALYPKWTPSGYCSSLSTLGLPEIHSPRSDRFPLSFVLLPRDLGKTEMPSLCPDPVPSEEGR